MINRRVEVQGDDGNWIYINFMNLRKGVIFRLHDDNSDGKGYQDGSQIWLAVGEPYYDVSNNNIGTILAEMI